MFQDLESISFSELTKHNSDVKMICSPNGQILAYADQNELVIKNLKSEENRTRFICDYTVDLISWSPDSELICCGMLKKSLIQVWNIMEPSWRCKIREGLLEITSITWAPDSRHLLVSCEFNFKITVWSCVSTEFTVIDNPKDCKNCISFSNCSKYMAVLQRQNFSDYIGIYSCDSWQLIKCFPIDTDSASEIQFSCLDLVIAILVSVAEDYKVLFYSIDGRLLYTFCKKHTILGITSLSWSPKNNNILLGDYFEMVTLLDGRSYKEIHRINLLQSISSVEVNIYRIVEISSSYSKYEIVSERPVIISPPSEIQKTKNKVVKRGIHIMQFSMDGQYVAIVGSMSNVLFIFKMKTFLFSDVIIHNAKIRSVLWHPSKPILMFCCAYNSVELWTPACCIRLISPYENTFLIKTAEWCASADALILNGKDNSAILSLP